MRNDRAIFSLEDMSLRTFLFIGLPFLVAAVRSPGAETNTVRKAEDWFTRAREVESRGLIKQAIELSGRAIEAAPRDVRLYLYRAGLFERTRQFASAETDLDKAVELTPDDASLYYRRGMVRLLGGRYQASVADLDHMVRLKPSRAAELWQRGIAMFYADQFERAQRQFEIHRTVNPGDVENSAWHFASVARTQGPERARELWMPVEGDRRIPMSEIQELMRGKGSEEKVLQAAEAVPAGRAQEEARFYARLYLALYCGAIGQREAEVRHATVAARDAAAFGLMGDIARLYGEWLTARLRQGPPK